MTLRTLELTPERRPPKIARLSTLSDRNKIDSPEPQPSTLRVPTVAKGAIDIRKINNNPASLTSPADQTEPGPCTLQRSGTLVFAHTQSKLKENNFASE
jgi:hypothetical protein